MSHTKFDKEVIITRDGDGSNSYASAHATDSNDLRWVLLSTVNSMMAEDKQRIEELQRQNAELLAALKEARSVIGSINSGRSERIMVDGEPMYRQTDEWVTWAKSEVLPMVDKAIAGEGK